MKAELINRAGFKAFADPVIITIDGIDLVDFTGIYNKERVDVQSNTAASYRHTLHIKTVDLESLPLTLEKNKNHTVTHDGTVYTVVDKINRSGGITELVLREYG